LIVVLVWIQVELREVLFVCLLTAFSVTYRLAAIAAFERPSAMCASTSRSRAVS
jgi:hypothetical protein